MFVFDDIIPAGILNAASWRLAAELVAGIPTARITETHPGGGQYDCLTIMTSGHQGELVHLDVNRNGSLHVHEAPQRTEGIPSERLWARATRPGGAEQLAAELLAATGLIKQAARARNRSAARLTYQVIAHTLTARSLDKAEWDCRSVNDESEGRQAIRADLRPEPGALEGAEPAQIWALTADRHVVAWLWEGWAYLPGGERVDLTRQRAAGASLADLAALITRRLPRGNAGQLPAAPPQTVPEQDPTGWLEWAGAYNAYQRLAATPKALEAVIAPARSEYQRDGRVPEWAGVDLLRGWLFLLYREDHFAGGYLFTPEGAESLREWSAVYEAWQARRQT